MDFPQYLLIEGRDVPPTEHEPEWKCVVKVTPLAIEGQLQSVNMRLDTVNPVELKNQVASTAINGAQTAMSNKYPGRKFHITPLFMSEDAAFNVMNGQYPLLSLSTGLQVWEFQSTNLF